MSRVFLAAFLAIVLAGCQTTFYEPGTTPLTVSPRVMKGFEKYKQAGYPLFFAVATDSSSYAYTTCPTIHCLDPSDQDAIAHCERSTAPGVKCKIFAYERQIVWKGPVAYAEKGAGAEPLPTIAEFDRRMKAAMVAPPRTSRDETVPGDARPFAITWDGRVTLAARTIELRLAKGRGTFRAPFGDTDVDCDGKYTVIDGKTGTWSVSCPDGLTAAGTFVSYGIGKGARGVGLDSNGRKVRYTIGPR